MAAVTDADVVASPFDHRNCNIVDPLAPWNNVGRSVSRLGLQALQNSLRRGQKLLFGQLLATLHSHELAIGSQHLKHGHCMALVHDVFPRSVAASCGPHRCCA